MNINTRFNTTIWVPHSRNEAIEIANILTNGDSRAAYELVLCHAAFGHNFNFDMGLVYINCICIKGKPTMRADALAGVCYNSGLVDFIHVTEYTEKHCTIECKRVDSDKVHQYTFDWKMAQQMNLTKNSSWQRMPKQMLKARCTAMATRAVFPDAVSGIYTADEMADSLDLTDKERFEITAQSLGEDDLKHSSRAPQPMPAPQPTKPPQQPQPTAKKNSHRSLYDFSSEAAFWQLIDEHNIDPAEVRGALDRYMHDVSMMDAQELETVFYEIIKSAIIRKYPGSLDNWWTRDSEKVDSVHQALCNEYPALRLLDPKHYGPRLKHAAFHETLEHVCILKKDEHRSRGLEVLEQMKPDDWSAYDYLVSL
jgi:hypothetical protein